MSGFKPMLAGKFREDKLTFPVLVQPKLDGIRASVVNGKLLTRSLKPIPNRYIRECLEQAPYEGLDGELIVGHPCAPDAFRKTTSAVMSPDGAPSFVFYAFDFWRDVRAFAPAPNPEPYAERHSRIEQILSWSEPCLVALPYDVAADQTALDELESAFVHQGYEGVILRSPTAPYKFGRGSATKFDLIKLKRFVDFEAEVVGFEEEMHNGNEAKTNALGRTERSSSKAGKTGKGTLGKLICRREDGVEFGVGTGFSAIERRALWAERGTLAGRTAKIKSFPIGEHEKPRFATFLGFRDTRDT